MSYKIDNFTFSDQSVKNLQRVGVTPDKIEGWIADGRKNGISDEGIRSFIVDRFNELNEPYMRGRTTGDAIRYGLHSTIPVLGRGVDELEAAIKSRSFFSGPEYEKQHADIEDRLKRTEQIFKENTKNGNWFDRNVVRYVPEAANATNEVLLAIGTGGASLMPKVALGMGAVEGFLGGNNSTNRSVKAAVEGGLRYGTASLLNKLFPTKEISQKAVDSAAKGELLGNKKPMANVIAKSIKTGQEPVSVIAKESTRATEPAILKNLQMALKGNDAQAKVVYDSAVKNVDYARNAGGFVKYMKDRMPKGLSEKVSTRLAKGFSALENGFEEVAGNTGDILVKENLPQMIDAVINTSMRGASAAERSAVKNAAIKAFSDRHVAKEITKKLIPQNMIGQLGNQISTIKPERIATRPISNWLNKGTLNTLTNTVPVPQVLGGAAQSKIPLGTRAVLDALLHR